jgi:large subunit ribosomal protein L31
MKQGIHPTYDVAQVTCACGNTWTTRSTKKVIRTDLCSKCHPFFTGEQRIVDTAGQVDRFMRRFQLVSTEPRVSKKAQRAAARRARIVSTSEEEAVLALNEEELETTVES